MTGYPVRLHCIPVYVLNQIRLGNFRVVLHTKKKKQMISVLLQRAKMDETVTSHTDAITKKLQSYSYATNQLYSDIPGAGLPNAGGVPAFMDTYSMANKLGMSVPNLAPDVEMFDAQQQEPDVTAVAAAPSAHAPVQFAAAEIGPQPAEGPRKKKYAKEAWPGRKPLAHVGLLV